MELEDVRKEYEALIKKHKLPSFKEINQEFELEKIERESMTFARVVRKVMMDKIVNSLGFLDMLLNGVQAPRIYHAYIKSMAYEDKQLIEKLYGIFGELSLSCLPLESDSNEEKEAAMIAGIWKAWQGNKGEFTKLLERVHKPISNGNRKEKSYFG